MTHQHTDRAASLAAELHDLGREARLGALSALGQLHDEVNLLRPPNVHRIELLTRRQHVAILAAMTATALDRADPSDLLAIAEGVAAGYTTTHRSPLDGDLPNRALAHAIGRVLDTVREAAAR